MTATLLARAREIAALTGDGNRIGTAFGRANVAMHAISASLQTIVSTARAEQGDRCGLRMAARTGAGGTR